MESGNELLMERRTEVPEPVGTAIKSIAFAVYEDDGLDSRLQDALSLARACSAHLQLVHVVPVEAYTVIDTYGGTFASGEIVKVLEEQAAKVRRRIEEHLSKEDVSWSYDVTTAPTLPELLRNAAFADLMFIGRQPSWHEFSRTGPSLLGELVIAPARRFAFREMAPAPSILSAMRSLHGTGALKPPMPSAVRLDCYGWRRR